VLENKEVLDLLEQVCKEELFKSAKDLNIVLPDLTNYPICILGPSEEWNEKEIHFFASSWVTEPKIFSKEIPTMADQLEEKTY
jgi:hypothetical protein